MRLRLLGLPPSTNNLYAVVAPRTKTAEPVRPRQILSAEGRRFHDALGAVAERAGVAGASEAPFAALITYHLRYDRDVDSSHKAVLDALSGVLWNDDRQVVLLALRKRRTPRGVLPWVSVVVRELAAKPSWAPLATPDGALAWGTDLLPPSTNNTYAVCGNARRLTREGHEVKEAYRANYARMALGAPSDDRLRLRLRYGFSADRRDVDGSSKLFLDAATGLLWHDDRQIMSLTLAKARAPRGTAATISADCWALP